MLVLNRRKGERIVVPDADLTITVLHLRGNNVRIGITAPKGCSIHREEVWARIQADCVDPNPKAPVPAE